MRKIITCVLATTILLTTLIADDYLNPDQPKLNSKEKHSLSLVKTWRDRNVKSYKGKDGTVKFIFGTSMPSIVTAPLRISDIELQAGEEVNDIQVGDATRWIISLSTSGPKNNLTAHVVIKPTDVNLKTTLVVMTDRRTYHFSLISRRYDYMPIVSFDYLGDMKNTLREYKREVNEKRAGKQLVVSNNPRVSPINIDSLNFNYIVVGNVPWKPIRVYNDGIKTYIQMPKKMKFNEAPILMVLDSSNNNQVVNYRLKDDRFIVDKIFTTAVLLLGVGEDKEEVKISFTDTSSYHKEETNSKLKALTHDEEN